MLDGAPQVQVGDFHELGMNSGAESEQQDDGTDVSQHWSSPLYRVDTTPEGWWSGVTTRPDDYTGLGRKKTGGSDTEEPFRVDRNTDGLLAVRESFSVRLRIGRGDRAPTRWSRFGD